ncbi:hypothetical protein LQW54_001321 [Pestalotiopsis sp. IQ-011]
MSSAQARNSSPPIRAPSTTSRSPTSISSRSEKSDSPVGNPAGTEDVAAASEKLLNGAKDVREIIRLVQKEHAIGDCSVDVTLNKVLDIIRAAVEQDREATLARNVSTRVTIIDGWGPTGVSSLEEKGAIPQAVKGGRIVSTYTLIEHGKLKYSYEVSYAAIGATEEEVTESDVAAFTGLKEMVPSGSAPSNQRLAKMINGFWADIIAVRAQTVRSELQAELSGEFDIPIFVCTLSFPAMPTFLHVFEPRYRRMVRRAMEGDRTFGMVLGSSSTSSDGRNFCEIGTLLRIVNIEFFPDGRSLLESVGVSRFRVLRHGALDDYVVGKIEKIDDVSLADEEAMEISETMNGQGVRDFVQSSNTQPTTAPDEDAPQQSEESNVLTVQDLETKSTRELLEIGITFVGKMRAQSVSWLTARVLAVFGDCPNDPALFPWWFASVLPVSDEEKYRLLGTSSVRQRMKICCRWIVEWEASRW